MLQKVATDAHLQSKVVAEANDVRMFPNGRAEIVTIDESVIGRVTYEPRWRSSKDLAPIMGTPTCQLHHVGYSISGVMRIVMDGGPVLDIPPGSAFEIPAGHDAWVLGDEPWVTAVWTSLRTYGKAPDGPGERGLATVVFTDIVDSTATAERLGDVAWRDLLTTHNSRLGDELNVFRGREVKTTGDGVLAVFDSASRAVPCAAAMTRAAREIGVQIRAGVHTGEVEFVGGDVRGIAVHAAERHIWWCRAGGAWRESPDSPSRHGDHAQVAQAVEEGWDDHRPSHPPSTGRTMPLT